MTDGNGIDSMGRGAVFEVSPACRGELIEAWLEQTTPDARLEHKLHEAEEWVAGMEARAAQQHDTPGG